LKREVDEGYVLKIMYLKIIMLVIIMLAQQITSHVKCTFLPSFENKKKILITGIAGMDGSNLAEYIFKNIPNVVIFGAMRNNKQMSHKNLKNIISLPNFFPVFFDLCNYQDTEYIFQAINPSLFFNCGAQTIVDNKLRKKNPDFINTLQVNTIAPLFHLQIIHKHNKKCRYLSCGSSEEFGITKFSPQTLEHSKNPINIYGISKCALSHIIKLYRTNYNIFCCHAILYNHECIKRPDMFLSKKIAKKIASIKLNMEQKKKIPLLIVGNIFSFRDWSDSKDIVKGFWEILNRDIPDDYILSANKKYSVKDFIDIGFSCIDVNLNWVIDHDEPLNTKAFYKDQLMVEIDSKFYRPNDNNRVFQGDNVKSCINLNWKPTNNLNNLLQTMINHEYDKLLQK
jgi:GDP-mannose 4,6-dehydratase